MDLSVTGVQIGKIAGFCEVYCLLFASVATTLTAVWLFISCSSEAKKIHSEINMSVQMGSHTLTLYMHTHMNAHKVTATFVLPSCDPEVHEKCSEKSP